MKFSLFYEMQISDPTPEREARLFHECVEQSVLADRLGYHCIWAVEHHGLYEYSHSSAPEIFLSFVAARTKRIRIGHGVTLTPGRYNHPIRIAERVAVLDILSGGRVQWGSGKSGTFVEQGAFEIDRTTFHDEWREAAEIIPRMWTEDVFSHRGRFYDIPPTRIVPKPVQRPHPPMFAACSKPELARLVGALGMGALNVAVYPPDVLARRVAEYREAVAGCRQPAGKSITNWFACNPATIVLRDDLEACRWGLRGGQFFLKSLVHYFATDRRPTGPVSAPREAPDDGFLEKFCEHRHAPNTSLSSIVGSPDHARRIVQRFVDVGVDELILVMQLGTVPHEIVMESIRTFAEEVMPHFTRTSDKEDRHVVATDR